MLSYPALKASSLKHKYPYDPNDPSDPNSKIWRFEGVALLVQSFKTWKLHLCYTSKIVLLYAYYSAMEYINSLDDNKHHVHLVSIVHVCLALVFDFNWTYLNWINTKVIEEALSSCLNRLKEREFVLYWTLKEYIKWNKINQNSSWVNPTSY